MLSFLKNGAPHTVVYSIPNTLVAIYFFLLLLFPGLPVAVGMIFVLFLFLVSPCVSTVLVSSLQGGTWRQQQQQHSPSSAAVRNPTASGTNHPAAPSHRRRLRSAAATDRNWRGPLPTAVVLCDFRTCRCFIGRDEIVRRRQVLCRSTQTANSHRLLEVSPRHIIFFLN